MACGQPGPLYLPKHEPAVEVEPKKKAKVATEEKNSTKEKTSTEEKTEETEQPTTPPPQPEKSEITTDQK